MVTSVLPYEEAKIRILNASHSCIAWAGSLIGQCYIHESTQTDAIRQMAYDYVTQDVIPSLTPSPLDLAHYRDVVLERFSNPYIRDTNQRVAADGFSKIPGFITPTLIECYQRGGVPTATAMLPALFFVFMESWHQALCRMNIRMVFWTQQPSMPCFSLLTLQAYLPVIAPFSGRWPMMISSNSYYASP